MGKKIVENTDSKPESKTIKGSRLVEWMWSLLQQQFLFQFAILTLVIVCIYPAYKSIRVLESTIEELEVDNRLLRIEINKIVSEERNVKTTIQNVVNEAKNNQTQIENAMEYLTTVNEVLKTEINMVRSKVHDAETEVHTLKDDVKNFQLKVDNLQTKSSKTAIAIKEMYKNFTIVEAELDKHKSSIQHLLNTTQTLNESKVDINTLQVVIKKKLAELSCQSGYEIGAHDYPTRSFPYDVTIKFDPPFQKKPAFAYGITLLDALKHLAVNAQLISLTEQSFSLRIISWGRGELYGARISWIACPK